MGRRYDAVLLDMGFTLVDVRMPPYDAYAEALGVPADAIRQAMDRLAPPIPDEAEDLDTHLRVWSLVYEKVLAEVGFDGTVSRGVEAMWKTWLGLWRLYDEVAGALSALQRAGYRMAVVSNWAPTLAITCDRLGITRFFDTVVTSAIEGCMKPDARIFEIALDRLGVPAERAVHVGDNYEADVLGATAAGIDAVLLHRDGRDAPIEPHDPTIRSLHELLELLDAR